MLLITLTTGMKKLSQSHNKVMFTLPTSLVLISQVIRSSAGAGETVVHCFGQRLNDAFHYGYRVISNAVHHFHHYFCFRFYNVGKG